MYPLNTKSVTLFIQFAKQVKLHYNKSKEHNPWRSRSIHTLHVMYCHNTACNYTRIYVYTKHGMRYAYNEIKKCVSLQGSIRKFGKDHEDSGLRVALACYTYMCMLRGIEGSA